MSNQNYSTKWGDVEARPGKRGGIEILSMNHERGRRLHVGTVIGSTYEKGNPAILRKPEPSFCMGQNELQAAKDAGAKFLRMITSDKKTYSIAITDFERNAERYFNAYYGDQLRVPLRCFQFSAAAAPRNPITDNPRSVINRDILPRASQQMSLWGR